MRVKFSWLSVAMCCSGVFLSMVGLGMITLGALDLGGHNTMMAKGFAILSGLMMFVGSIAGMIESIREFARRNTIIIDLEDLRREEVKREMQEAFDKFIKDYFKQKT